MVSGQWLVAGAGIWHAPRARRGRRRGITLLEVLISIFVLAVGLLGVAALIPAGVYFVRVQSQDVSVSEKVIVTKP